jgi:tetratricopeptide (TPR) repeat protein
MKKQFTDPQKFADALLAWVQANPKSRAIPNAAGFYDEVVRGHLKSGDTQKAMSMIQAFQAAVPNDTVLLPSLYAASFQAKNYAKAAEVGEKLYAAKPGIAMATDLATIFRQLNNTDKYLFYSEKILAEVPIEKSFSLALDVAAIYAQRRATDKALGLYSQIMSVYGDKVPPNVSESAWNTVRAQVFTAMAGDAWGKNDKAKAVDLYQRVVGFAPKGEEACTAYYFMGMAKWQSKDQKGAIDQFARAYVLNKGQSAKSKEYLETLWKAENKDTLDGLDAFLAKIKSELGIG